jgi:hypothetical protein
MAKDNKDKESYQAGISSPESFAGKGVELYQDHPISTLDEFLVGWLVKTEADPMPEILMINGTVYQKIKIIRYAE